MEQIVAFLTNGGMANLGRVDDDTIIAEEFQAKNFISKVIIPEDVIEIGEKAFKDCCNLEEVVLPNGLKRIHSSAFENCKKLKKINLPNSVEIGQRTFSGCEVLSDIVLPEKIDAIPKECFDCCRSLKEITLPETVTTIGARAFRGTSLREIHFSDNLTKIGTEAFAGSNIAKVTGNTKNIVFVGEQAFALTPISLNKDENNIFRIDNIIIHAGTTPKEMAFEDCLFASDCFYGNKTAKKLFLTNCRGINPSAFRESSVEVVQITGKQPTIFVSAFENCNIDKFEIDVDEITLSTSAFKGVKITDLFLWADNIKFKIDFARNAHIKYFTLKHNPKVITYNNDTFTNGIFDEVLFVGGTNDNAYIIPDNETLVKILNSVYQKESA